MASPSSRSDETEMNHTNVHSCSFQQGIGPRLISLLVWLQQGRDLQRSQILQVPPVINQSNMSQFLAPWPALLQFTDRTLIAAVQLPRHTSVVEVTVKQRGIYDLKTVVITSPYTAEKKVVLYTGNLFSLISLLFLCTQHSYIISFVKLFL